MDGVLWGHLGFCREVLWEVLWGHPFTALLHSFLLRVDR